MGASVIITGLSSEIAQTLVTIGVDLSKMNAVGDLQGGIEEAEAPARLQSHRSGEPARDILLIEGVAPSMPVPILKQGPT